MKVEKGRPIFLLSDTTFIDFCLFFLIIFKVLLLLSPLEKSPVLRIQLDLTFLPLFDLYEARLIYPEGQEDVLDTTILEFSVCFIFSI